MSSTKERTLSSSLPSLLYVITAPIESRVQEGDSFIIMASSATNNAMLSLCRTVAATPVPRCRIVEDEGLYYELQLEAALNLEKSAPFFMSHQPYIGIVKYVERLFHVASTLSLQVCVMMMRLLDRAMAKNPALFLHSGNAHKLVFSAFLVATKYHEDIRYSFRMLAELGGLSVQQCAILEIAFLSSIDYRCYIENEEFSSLENALIGEAIYSTQRVPALRILLCENIVNHNQVSRRVEVHPIQEENRANIIEKYSKTLENSYRKQFPASTRKLSFRQIVMSFSKSRTSDSKGPTQKPPGLNPMAVLKPQHLSRFE